MKKSRIIASALTIGLIPLQAMFAGYSAGQIKVRLGKLVGFIVSQNQQLHPHEILRLFIHLLQHYCALDPKPEITQLCATLQGLLNTKEARPILDAVKRYNSPDILPPEVIVQISKMTLSEQICLLKNLNRRLKEPVPVRSIHELEQQAFQQCI